MIRAQIDLAALTIQNYIAEYISDVCTGSLEGKTLIDEALSYVDDSEFSADTQAFRKYAEKMYQSIYLLDQKSKELEDVVRKINSLYIKISPQRKKSLAFLAALTAEIATMSVDIASPNVIPNAIIAYAVVKIGLDTVQMVSSYILTKEKEHMPGTPHYDERIKRKLYHEVEKSRKTSLFEDTSRAYRFIKRKAASVIDRH